MRPPNKNLPHRDGDWYFDGRNLKRRNQRVHNLPPQQVPTPLKRVPSWISVLVLCMILGCIVFPPVFTTLMKGHP